MTAETPAGPFPRRKYRQPPVVEAIARLRWTSPLDWKITTPGQIYERVNETYPGEPQLQNLLQAGLGHETEGGPAAFQVTTGPQRVVFRNSSGNQLLSVAPREIAVHGLPPYEGWEALEARLFEALEQLGDISPQPNFNQASLRYINRIDIPAEQFEFTTYLTISFAMPPAWPSQVTGFMDRFESLYPDGNTKIAFTWASTDSPAGSSSFVVDLDLTSDIEPAVNIGESRRWLAELKERETQAFESLLQDSLRELFDEVK